MERKKLHEKVLYPVVRVIAKKAMGSGTILYSKPSETVPNEYETYVLTNCHVVEDSISYKKEWDALLKRDVKKEILDAVQVQEFRYYTGRSVVVGESSVQADIVAYDKTQDLALLKARDVKKYEFVAEMFPRDGKLEMLMELLCVGCGMGERPLMTYGFLSGMNREIDNYPYHLSSANSVFGNSGGAVFEKESMQFVGVPSRIAVSLFGQAITHMGYFIPVDRVYKFLDEQIFEFIYDPTQTPSACAKRREEKREKDRIFAANVSEESEK